jgi:hypothetical protein
MKTKSILTVMLTTAAIGACLIPMLAQQAGSQEPDRLDPRNSEPAGIAQRERADLFAAAQSAAASQVQGYAGAPAAIQSTEGQLGQLNPLMSSQQALPSLVNVAPLGGRSVFDPALAKAINESNAEVAGLIKQLKESEADADKESIKEKIKTELELQYDTYLEFHEQPLKQLEERLAKLREEFDARKKAKDDLVKLRLDTIWYESQGLGWPSNRTTTLWRDNGFPGGPASRYPATWSTPFAPDSLPNPPVPPTPNAPPTRRSGPAR